MVYTVGNRFTAPLTRRCKTKFPTVYRTSPNKKIEYSYPLIQLDTGKVRTAQNLTSKQIILKTTSEVPLWNFQ